MWANKETSYHKRIQSLEEEVTRLREENSKLKEKHRDGEAALDRQVEQTKNAIAVGGSEFWFKPGLLTSPSSRRL